MSSEGFRGFSSSCTIPAAQLKEKLPGSSSAQRRKEFNKEIIIRFVWVKYLRFYGISPSFFTELFMSAIQSFTVTSLRFSFY